MANVQRLLFKKRCLVCLSPFFHYARVKLMGLVHFLKSAKSISSRVTVCFPTMLLKRMPYQNPLKYFFFTWWPLTLGIFNFLFLSLSEFKCCFNAITLKFSSKTCYPLENSTSSNMPNVSTLKLTWPKPPWGFSASTGSAGSGD